MNHKKFKLCIAVRVSRFLCWLVILLLGSHIVSAQRTDKSTNDISDPGFSRSGVRQSELDLAGTWQFKIDSLDKGESEGWYSSRLSDEVKLPGSMTTNNKGDDITLHTPWTGQIVDSSYFLDPKYAPYRKPGNIKIPFWLQPVKYYKGAAWYQREVMIPAGWKGHPIDFFIERAHWETTVWVDDHKVGTQNSLSTAHVYDLGAYLSPGKHRISVRVDNRAKDVKVGLNSHSITDHTQTNWNGMIGRLLLIKKPLLYVSDVKVYPDVENKQIRVRVTMVNSSAVTKEALLKLSVLSADKKGRHQLPLLRKQVQATKDSSTVELIYSMGRNPELWDEFNPNLYVLKVQLSTGNERDNMLVSRKSVQFGMREFKTSGRQFVINGRKTFLRGTLECAIFPLTGYPPTDKKAWARIYKIARAYGLNHIRFHSWCPPEAAFEAADEAGFYLQVECASWASTNVTVGDGLPLDNYLYKESNAIVDAYGNHPSFCMMAYGNEPAGVHSTVYLTRFVQYWQNKDARRLYTTGGGWPVVPQSDYNSSPDPRVQAWGAGLKSIINAQPPTTEYDWREVVSKWPQPTVSHEIGQWCVYPDFKEMKDYTGILKPKNFEIFQTNLDKSGLGRLADSFVLASGKLQVLCYKADIEAALRTPGFGGFQLLDLHDFPGQGTALVGVLSPFWKDKGYVTGDIYSQFCNAVVPLVRLPKMIWQNNETLEAQVEIANFGAGPLEKVQPVWTIQDQNGKQILSGKLPVTDIAVGNGIQLGRIQASLKAISKAAALTLTVKVGQHKNSWKIYVYPAKLPVINDVLVTPQLDQNALNTLRAGGKVLLSIKKGQLKDELGGKIPIGFSSIFWNTAWTRGQAPHSLGILCNPKCPALADFPTDYYSSWQWWDAMRHGSAIELDRISKDIQPIVRVIDDWFTARSLGLVFECKVGKGRLVVSGIDLISDAGARPEARQLKYSLLNYMQSAVFNPEVEVPVSRISNLLKSE